MVISGYNAAQYDAIRFDSFERVNKGILVRADDVAGHVIWLDATGKQKEIMLGLHAIKLLKR